MRVSELNVGLIQYYVGLDCVYAALLVEGQAARTFRLAPWAEIFPQLDKFMEAIGGGYPPAARDQIFHDFSHGWGRRLLPPFEALQGLDVLVVIPHYLLHGLPLHTVWLEETGQYLGLTHAMSYCSGGTLLTRCQDLNPDRLEDLAAWEFSPATDWHRGAPARPEVCCSYGVDVKFGNTDAYRELAGLFARGFKKGQLFDSSPRFVLKADHMGWQAICVVCHGYYDLANPDASGLLLDREIGGLSKRPIVLHRDHTYFFHDLPYRSPPVEAQLEPGRVPELMTVAELKVEYQTTAGLVALLGCSTGTGHTLSGDDYNSLAYQWLKMGAASVLASLWELDFEFISAWIPVFLEEWLKNRKPKAVAWSQALRKTLERRPELPPYEWGVMALLGDWL